MSNIIEITDDGKLIELLATGTIYVNGGGGGATAWGAITGTLSNQTDLQSALNAKQNILVNTENIKSINGESILGAGNLVVAGGGANLAYTASPTQGVVTSDTGTDATIPAGSTTNASLMLPADKTKLDGVQAGATANATDAQLRDRSTHTGTQAISTVTGLQTALDGKQPTGDYATNTALTNGLATKANVSHTHVIADVTNLQTTLDGKAPLVHTHVIADVTGLQTALNAKQNTITTGITSQYFRGDFSLATLDKTAVGLSNVANADTTTTANITDSTNKRFITDAQQTVLGNTSGTNTGDNAVNSLYSGLATSKQDTLVSGTNIKTINSQSLLGSGDITISGGGGATDLAYVASSTNGVVTSSTGNSATIPAGSTTNASLLLPADKTKLDGIASGATANSTDAQLRDRATHTGTQLASTISDFASTVLATLLTGLSTATNTAILATDSVLIALGKLQAQITSLGTSKENTITSGTTSQYFRGDKTFQTLDKSAVGLANVDNTSDANKPISTATQTALNAKENTLNADQKRKVTVSTSAPSGGVDGDIWLQYTP